MHKGVPNLEQEEDGFDGFLTSSSKTEFARLPCSNLIEYEDQEFQRITGRPQPFRSYDDEMFQALVASVAEHGVIEPIIVRPCEGKYQILAGRNRNRAAKANQQQKVPCIIKHVDDTDAALIMIETNLRQRHNLLYSEKAWAYRMERDLRAHRGKGTDAGDTLEGIGKEKGDSRRTVAYLIRLTELLPELLDMVDKGSINFTAGVKLSYIAPSTQKYIVSAIIPKYGKIKIGQAAALQRLVNPTSEQIDRVFNTKKAPPSSVTVKTKDIAATLGYEPDKKEVIKLWNEFLLSLKNNLG